MQPITGDRSKGKLSALSVHIPIECAFISILRFPENLVQNLQYTVLVQFTTLQNLAYSENGTNLINFEMLTFPENLDE